MTQQPPLASDNSLALVPYPELSPCAVPIPAQLPTFCLLVQFPCSESEVRRFSGFCEENGREVAGLAVVIAEDCPWEALNWAVDIPKLYWTQNQGFFEPYNSSKSAILLVMRGLFVLQSLSPPPANYLSCLSQPLDLPELAEKVALGDTERLMQAYFLTRQTHAEMNSEGIRELLQRIGLEYGLDLEKALEWYQSPICEGDRSDIIDPKDVSFREFTKRLQNYCRNLPIPHEKPTEFPSSTKHKTVLALKTRLQACESQILSLLSSVSARDNTISQLLQRLEANEREIDSAKGKKSAEYRSHLSSTDLQLTSTDLNSSSGELKPGPAAALATEFPHSVPKRTEKDWKLLVMPPPIEPVRAKDADLRKHKRAARNSQAPVAKADNWPGQRQRATSKAANEDKKTLKMAGKLSLTSKAV